MTPRALGWWTISGEDLMEMMQRTHDGEKPAIVYAETYANSSHEYPWEDKDGEA